MKLEEPLVGPGTLRNRGQAAGHLLEWTLARVHRSEVSASVRLGAPCCLKAAALPAQPRTSPRHQPARVVVVLPNGAELEAVDCFHEEAGALLVAAHDLGWRLAALKGLEPLDYFGLPSLPFEVARALACWKQRPAEPAQ